jgi:hypothetical protein
MCVSWMVSWFRVFRLPMCVVHNFNRPSKGRDMQPSKEHDVFKRGGGRTERQPEKFVSKFMFRPFKTYFYESMYS